MKSLKDSSADDQSDCCPNEIRRTGQVPPPTITANILGDHP